MTLRWSGGRIFVRSIMCEFEWLYFSDIPDYVNFIQLTSFPPFDYTCVDLIPNFRRKQHFFQEQILDYLKAQTEVYKSGKKQVDGTLEEYLAPYVKKLKETVGEEQVKQMNI